VTSRDDPSRRVAITGLGVITALGSSVPEFWDHLLAGHSGVRRITQFDPTNLPCQIAGEIPSFDPTEFIPAKEARRMSRASQVALAAAHRALADSALPSPLRDPERAGVSFGTAIGGLERMVAGIELFRAQGLAKVNPFTIPSGIPNQPAFYISNVLGPIGPSLTITTACATGAQAIGEGAELIRTGRADVVFAGGVEALIEDFALAGFAAMRALPTSFNDDPARASRPFDARREGFVFSEGGACMVLERLDQAMARGAHIYAELAGHASSGDGFHVAAPDPSAAGPIRTMRWALGDAQLAPEEVDYINAHGTSTPANDVVETVAIKAVFGEAARRIPISSTKSMIGHAMGASGAIEAVVCALTIMHGVIHPTINYEVPDPECDLDYVPNIPRHTPVRVALSNSFGLGGQNACLVLKQLEVT
jgi:beta-ketoacyl-acyl-carrier-protein synthase II